MMTKPKTFDAYNGAVTEAAERVLVTLLRATEHAVRVRPMRAIGL